MLRMKDVSAMPTAAKARAMSNAAGSRSSAHHEPISPIAAVISMCAVITSCG